MEDMMFQNFLNKSGVRTTIAGVGMCTWSWVADRDPLSLLAAVGGFAFGTAVKPGVWSIVIAIVIFLVAAANGNVATMTMFMAFAMAQLVTMANRD